MFSEENPVIERVIGEDSSEKALTIKNHINLSVENYIASQWDVANTRLLNNQYWNLLNFLVKRRVTEMKQNSVLTFGKPERIALDFGYISCKLVQGIKDFNEESLDEILISKIPEKIPLKFYSISTWLSFKLREFDGTSMYKKLKKQYDTSIFDIEILKKDIEMNMKSKRALVDNFRPAFSSERDSFNKIVALTGSIEQASDRYALIKYKIQAGYALRKEERLEFVNIENAINNARSDRKRIFKTIAQGADIRNLFELSSIEDTIIQKEREMFELISATGRQNSYINKLLDSQKIISNKQREEFLSERIYALKNAVAAIVKHEKKDPALFLSTRPVKGVPEKYASAIATIFDIDKFIFYNKKVAAQGYPCVIFFPGNGLSAFDSQNNSFMFSQFPDTNYDESVLAAFGHYRWNFDEESKIRYSYSQLKSNSQLSGQALEQSFVKNYCAYINMERGFAKKIELDREIKEWFAWQIFAKKEVETFSEGQKATEPENKGSEAQKTFTRHPSGLDFEDFEKIVKSSQEKHSSGGTKTAQTAQEDDGEIIDIEQIIKTSPLRNTIIELLNEEAGDAPADIKDIEKKTIAGEKIISGDGEIQTLEQAGIINRQEANYHEPALKKNIAPHDDKKTDRIIISELRPEERDKNIKALYEKLKAIFKAADIEKKVSIVNSDVHGKVDISISGVEIRDLHHLLNLISIQMKTFGIFSEIIKKT